MFQTIFQVDLSEVPLKFGNKVIKNLVVKKNILASEVMFVDSKDRVSECLFCEIPESVRELINNITEE